MQWRSSSANLSDIPQIKQRSLRPCPIFIYLSKVHNGTSAGEAFHTGRHGRSQCGSETGKIDWGEHFPDTSPSVPTSADRNSMQATGGDITMTTWFGRKMLFALAVAGLFGTFCVPAVAQYGEDYEYEPGEGLHEEEWYDPSDWDMGYDDPGVDYEDSWGYTDDYYDDDTYYGEAGYGDDDAWYEDDADYTGYYEDEYDDDYNYDYGYDDGGFMGDYTTDDYYTDDWYDDESAFDEWYE
jgi:hypothetical protein